MELEGSGTTSGSAGSDFALTWPDSSAWAGTYEGSLVENTLVFKNGAEWNVIAEPFGGMWSDGTYEITITQSGLELSYAVKGYEFIGSGTVSGLAFTLIWPVGSPWAGTYGGEIRGKSMVFSNGLVWHLTP